MFLFQIYGKNRTTHSHFESILYVIFQRIIENTEKNVTLRCKINEKQIITKHEKRIYTNKELESDYKSIW